MQEEIWKDVPGYEGLYKVSSLGRVKNKKGLMLTGRINKRGYLRAALFKNKKVKELKFHQLVAMAFLGHIPNGMNLVVDHINGNKLDNRVDNLRIVTQRENCVSNGKTSKYRGVHFCRTINKFIAKIYINGKIKHLGRFDSDKEASLAYKKALKELL